MKIVQSGERFSFVNVTATHNQLPKGNYLLRKDEGTGEFYLQLKEGFVLPKKIYGDHSITKRWLKSFQNNSEKNMGIILSGIKGSGKTITSQMFCMESDLPVIIIGEDFSGSGFVDFLTNPLLGNCIIFIDEFEKIYSRNEDTVDLLSLMDGNYPTKLIFLMTVNEFRLSEYLVNRLNRIKYRKHYIDLEQDIIDEVCNDLLVNKTHRASIDEFFDRINMRTFDLLINVIKDMNLFEEDALQCGKHLNLTASNKYYDVFEEVDGQLFPCESMHLSPDDKDYDINRKGTTYLPNPEKHGYYVSVDLDKLEWTITKGRGQFTVECAATGKGKNKVGPLKFKFVESKISLVF